MKVFISHAHQDADLAARIAQGLQSNGLEAWDADSNLLPGDNWAAGVGRALEESEAMVVLLTPAAIDSQWVLHEMEYALGAKNYSNRLIPVVVGGRDSLPSTGIPWIVRRMPWIELREGQGGLPEVKPIADAIRSAA